MLKKIFVIMAIVAFAAFGVEKVASCPDGFIDKDNSIKLQFQQKDADARQARLEFEARIDWSSLGGYAPVLTTTINGVKIPGRRLLNKPLQFKTRSGGGTRWTLPEGGSWYVMYSPDFSDAIKTNEAFIYGLYEKDQEPYRFVLDITGMTQHVGVNEIVLSSYMKCCIRNVSVVFDEKAMPRINDVDKKKAAAPTGSVPDLVEKEPEQIATRLERTAEGKLRFVSPNGAMTMTSRFSLPKGGWLDGKYADGEIQEGTAKVRWETEEYVVERTIKAENGRLHFTDVVSNRLQQVIGLRLDNAVELPSEPDKTLFSGREVMLRTYGPLAGQPTCCALSGEAVTAIVLEDDILRLQGKYSRYGKTLKMLDENLGLAPGGKHTLEWSVYVLPKGGYYALINRVRRDWGSNFQVNGPFSFPYGGGCNGLRFNYWDAKNPVTEAATRKFLKDRPVAEIITHVPGNYSIAAKDEKPGWTKLGHGTAYFLPTYEWWRNSTKNMTAALRKYAPGVRVHTYLHKNLCSEPGAQQKYADSLALDGTSRKLFSEKSCRLVPTVNNSYGKALAEVYKSFVNDLDTDVYMDEICYGVNPWEKYPEWDGATVRLEQGSNKIKEQVSIPNLLVRGWLDEMMDFLEKHDRKLIANGPPVHRKLQDRHAVHFVEQCMGIGGLMGIQLTSPVGFCYGHGEKGFEHYLEALSCGVVCLLYSGEWSRHSFPFTPIELNEGYLIAQERIITSKSGIFGWKDGAEAAVFAYNEKGEPMLDEGMVAHKVQDGRHSYEIRMPEGRLVILVRKDQADAALPVPPLPGQDKFAEWNLTNAKLRPVIDEYVTKTIEGVEVSSKETYIDYFQMKGIDAKPGDKVEIKGKISGKGKVGIGFYAYKEKSWSAVATPLKYFELGDEPQEIAIEFTVPANAGTLRPLFRLNANSKFKVAKYSFGVN